MKLEFDKKQTKEKEKLRRNNPCTFQQKLTLFPANIFSFVSETSDSKTDADFLMK